MFPKTIQEATGKTFYYETDIFSVNPLHLVKAAEREANYQIGMHSHQFYEINIVTKGSGCHYIEQMSVPAKKGDVFVIPPDIRHGYYCGYQLEVFHVMIKKEFFRRYREELEGCPGYQTLFEIEPFLRQKSKEQFFLHLDYEELFQIMSGLERVMEKEEQELYMPQIIVALDIICTLCSCMHQQYYGNTEGKGEGHELIRVIEYIQTHLDQKLMVAELANMAAMSTSTFTRTFKKILGLSPMEYVRNSRITKAVMLIEEGEFSKSEIAQICGFYDAPHMDKYLKNISLKLL